MSLLHIIQLHEKYRLIAEEAGITLNINHDFKELKGKKKGLSPLFDLDYVDLLPDQAFWIEGKDQSGNTVHAQALRLDNVKQDHLSDLINNQLRRCFGDPTLPVSHSKNALDQLHGRCVYHGDMWLDPAFRKKGVGYILNRLGVLTSLLQFKFDYTYAFMEQPNADKGYGLRTMYYHASRSFWYWPAWLDAHEYILYSSAEEIARTAELVLHSSDLKPQLHPKTGT